MWGRGVGRVNLPAFAERNEEERWFERVGGECGIPTGKG